MTAAGHFEDFAPMGTPPVRIGARGTTLLLSGLLLRRP